MSEIIIDGVNVAECDRYNDFPCKFGQSDAICLAHSEQWGGFDKPHCKDRPDCYYKQLRRLQAENERLKEINLQLQTIDMEIDRNNKYRKALEEIRGMVDEPCVPTEKDCLACPSNCFTKDILIKINEVLK